MMFFFCRMGKLRVRLRAAKLLRHGFVRGSDTDTATVWMVSPYPKDKYRKGIAIFDEIIKPAASIEDV